MSPPPPFAAWRFSYPKLSSILQPPVIFAGKQFPPCPSPRLDPSFFSPEAAAQRTGNNAKLAHPGRRLQLSPPSLPSAGPPLLFPSLDFLSQKMGSDRLASSTFELGSVHLTSSQQNDLKTQLTYLANISGGGISVPAEAATPAPHITLLLSGVVLIQRNCRPHFLLRHLMRHSSNFLSHHLSWRALPFYPLLRRLGGRLYIVYLRVLLP